jgi:hypothetical protein
MNLRARRFSISLLLFALLGFSAAADPYATVSGIVRFHADIGSLVRNQKTIEPATLYLVEGMVTSVRIIRSDAQNFYAELDLISAEWNKDDLISTYQIILVCAKPSFNDLIAAKESGLKENQAGPNSRLLALIQYANAVPASNGKDTIPVFIAQDFRILK